MEPMRSFAFYANADDSNCRKIGAAGRTALSNVASMVATGEIKNVQNKKRQK
jgi:hypothetical protein